MKNRVIVLAFGLLAYSGAEAAEWRAILMFSHLTSSSLISVTDVGTGATHYEKCYLKTTERLSMRELDEQMRQLHPSNCKPISVPVLIDGDQSAEMFNRILTTRLRKVIEKENQWYSTAYVNGVIGITGSVAATTIYAMAKFGNAGNLSGIQRMSGAIRGVMGTPFPYLLMAAATIKVLEAYGRTSDEYAVENLLPRLKEEVIGRRASSMDKTEKTEVLKIMDYFEKALGQAAADFNAA